MSIGMRIPRDKALATAGDFKALLNVHITCEKFEWAGSIRREAPDVGDCDAVVIPRWGDVPMAGDLFGATERKNLLWERVDSLVGSGTFAKHIKDTAAGPRTKWGDKSRAIEFRGTCYEITIADEANWYLWLAIRTGPGVVSKEIVTRLPERGYRFTDDHAFHLEHRDGVHAPTPVIPASEKEVFDLAGIGFKLPHQR